MDKVASCGNTLATENQQATKKCANEVKYQADLITAHGFYLNNAYRFKYRIYRNVDNVNYLINTGKQLPVLTSINAKQRQSIGQICYEKMTSASINIPKYKPICFFIIITSQQGRRKQQDLL